MQNIGLNFLLNFNKLNVTIGDINVNDLIYFFNKIHQFQTWFLAFFAALCPHITITNGEETLRPRGKSLTTPGQWNGWWPVRRCGTHADSINVVRIAEMDSVVMSGIIWSMCSCEGPVTDAAAMWYESTHMKEMPLGSIIFTQKCDCDSSVTVTELIQFSIHAVHNAHCSYSVL